MYSFPEINKLGDTFRTLEAMENNEDVITSMVHVAPFDKRNQNIIKSFVLSLIMFHQLQMQKRPRDIMPHIDYILDLDKAKTFAI